MKALDGKKSNVCLLTECVPWIALQTSCHMTWLRLDRVADSVCLWSVSEELLADVWSHDTTGCA